MNESDFVKVQVEMAVIFRQIKAMPLDEMIEKLNLTLTLAPMLDPTAYIQFGDNAEKTMEIFMAFRRLRDTLEKGFKTSTEIN